MQKLAMKHLNYAAILVLLPFLFGTSCGNQEKKAEQAKYVSDTQLTAALGKWQRSDSPYVLVLSNIKTDSTLVAKYLNPKSINISETHWKTSDGYFYFYIKFDDEGYPGSYYSLGYYPEEDRLFGFYYQAMQKQKYDVVFERML